MTEGEHHPDDPWLRGFQLTEVELDSLGTLGKNVEGESPGVVSLQSRGIVTAVGGLAAPYEEMLTPLTAPDLVVLAERHDKPSFRERRYVTAGDRGLVIGESPDGGRFISPCDRPHLPELVARFLGLKSWSGGATDDSLRLVSERGMKSGALLDLMLTIGRYARISVRAAGASEATLGWLDDGNGAIWSVEPAPDPRDISADGPIELTVQPVSGAVCVQAVLDAVSLGRS